MPISTLTEPVRTFDELTTGEWKITVSDQDGVVVPSANINAITINLYNDVDGVVINSRDGQDVFGANNGTYHATSGLFTWDIQSTDTPIKALTDHNGILHVAIATKPSDHRWLEQHWAVLNFNFSTTEWSRFVLPMLVRQLPKVT